MVDQWRLIVDFGMLVLIWMVQLIVYPSFRYYPDNSLNGWHHVYTRRISMIVIPLMLAQLAIYLYEVVFSPSLLSFCCIGILLILWIVTFSLFVPAHNRISRGEHTDKSITLLIRANWIRTFLWTLLFMVSLLQ